MIDVFNNIYTVKLSKKELIVMLGCLQSTQVLNTITQALDRDRKNTLDLTVKKLESTLKINRSGVK